MASDIATTREPLTRAALVGVAGVLAVAAVALWSYRAFSDGATYDSGLAYVGGQVAWSTGHPETWFSWTGTPFLAAMLAAVTRIMSARAMGTALTALNLILVLGTVAVVLRRLRSVLEPGWLALAGVVMLTFAPIMSSVWWKQFNIISLVLSVAGFGALRRQRLHLGGFIIGLSLALKPLAILLPVTLLTRRGTRRAGLWSIVYLIGLNLAAQILIAAHAHSTSALNPLLGLRNFADKSKPAAGLACSAENFAPSSLLCQGVGTADVTLQRAVVLLAVALVAWWLYGVLDDRRGVSWETFAFTCALSTMVSPIAWSHYQVMLLPLFILLLVRFARARAALPWWIGWLVALGLAELMWSPYGTLTDALQFKLASTFHADPHPTVTAIAQFSQYLLIGLGGLWYVRNRSAARASARPQFAAPAVGDEN